MDVLDDDNNNNNDNGNEMLFDSLIDDIIGNGCGGDREDNRGGDDCLGSDTCGGGGGLETEYIPKPRQIRMFMKQQFARIAKEQALGDVVPNMPETGESVHVLSGARFDYWTWVPHILKTWFSDGGKQAEMLYCSTWTMSRPNTVDLFKLWDAGMFQNVAFLTGLYFKRRETAVYSMLLNGIRTRGGRYRALLNHTKVLLINKPDKNIWLTIEGSANLTSNPRLEQYVITNHKGLWTFHRDWMEEVLTK